MAQEMISLDEIKAVVENVDKGFYHLGEKISYLSGFLNGARGRLALEAEKYLAQIILYLRIICNGGVIANVQIKARGRFDVMPYRALDLLPVDVLQL